MFVHIYAYYIHILRVYIYIVHIICIFDMLKSMSCIFCAHFGMQMHIQCIFQFCRSPVQTGSGLFLFRSGSTLATASHQHFIASASKHTHLPGSGDRRASPGRVALGLAAQEQSSDVRWPVDSLALHQLP